MSKRGKRDEARLLFGPAFEAISKNTFALLAWHLANRCSGTADEPGAAERVLIDEIAALGANHIITAVAEATGARELTKLASAIANVSAQVEASKATSSILEKLLTK